MTQNIISLKKVKKKKKSSQRNVGKRPIVQVVILLKCIQNSDDNVMTILAALWAKLMSIHMSWLF